MFAADGDGPRGGGGGVGDIFSAGAQDLRSLPVIVIGGTSLSAGVQEDPSSSPDVTLVLQGAPYLCSPVDPKSTESSQGDHSLQSVGNPAEETLRRRDDDIRCGWCGNVYQCCLYDFEGNWVCHPPCN